MRFLPIMDNKIQYSITIWIFLYDILFEHVVTEYSVFVILKSGNFHRKSLIGKVALNGQHKTLCSNISVFPRKYCCCGYRNI